MSATRLHKGARWFSVEHGFFSHPKTVRAGEDAAFLFLAGLDYCGERLTDGVIPKAMVPRLTTKRHADRLAARLVAVGYWHDEGDHYRSHEYLTRYPSKTDVEAKRAKDRNRKGSGTESARIPRGTGTDSDATPPGIGTLEVEVDREESKTLVRPAPPSDPMAGFDRFKAAYPRKQKWPAAERAWKAPKVRAARHVEAILADIETRWLDKWRTEPQFVPLPASYLHERRWEDAPDPSGRNGSGPSPPADEDEGDTVLIVGKGRVPLDEAKRQGWV